MGYPSWWDRAVDGMNTFQAANPQNLPGAVFAAETPRDGRLISAVGEGWDYNTICCIGSMSKTFVATAVLLALEENDILALDTPVCRLPGMEAFTHDEVKRQIEISHLLLHTSGLPLFLKYSDFVLTPCNDPHGSSPCCGDIDPVAGPTSPWIGSPGYTNECVLVDGRCQPSRRAMLDKVSSYIMETYPLTQKPGSQYSYSSANHIVAARIVEQLTGRSINAYLKEKLFIPAGMPDSFFVAQGTGDSAVDSRIDEGVTEQQRGRIADVSLITWDGKMPPEVAPGPDGTWDKFRRGWRFVYPDGGMYSTANDLLNFLQILRDGGVRGPSRILSRAVLNLMLNDQGHGHTMAFGYRSQTTPYGQGPGTIEHLGNIMTYFWYDPGGPQPLLGVFLSQRLSNVIERNNMRDGMKVIFRVFVPTVSSELYQAHSEHA